MMNSIKRWICYILYYAFAQHLPPSYTPGGKIFTKIRYKICRHLFISCGERVNIESRASFNSGKQISIGNNSGIGINALLSGSVTIGDNVMMGPDVKIFSRNHRYESTDIPMNQQGFTEDAPVIIEDDVWISAGVIILPGVRIGKGSIIGAGSVLTKDVFPWAIVAGNPATVIKMRK